MRSSHDKSVRPDFPETVDGKEDLGDARIELSALCSVTSWLCIALERVRERRIERADLPALSSN